MSPVARTTTHIGPNGRVPAIHNCGAPVTYRMLACRPSTRMSRSCEYICASARSRRPVRSAAASGETSVALGGVAIGGVAIGGVGVVGDRREAVLVDHHDLLTAVAARPVLPHHRLQEEEQARGREEI